MKKFYSSKGTKRVVKANLPFGDVTDETVRNYKSWLDASGLDEKSILKFRFYRSLTIKKEILENGAYLISLSVDINNDTVPIGMSLVSESAVNNSIFFIDASFLLLYIAERLDEANRAIPPLNFKLEEHEYFHNTVSDFLKGELRLIGGDGGDKRI